MPAIRSTCTSRSRKVLLIITFLLSALSCVLYLSQPPVVAVLNNRTTDAVMASAPACQASGSVIIVDIDEKSLASFGQWPWPRSLLAQLLDSLAASGAGSIGLDMVLAEPGRAFPGTRSLPLGHDGSSPPAGTQLPAQDDILARTLSTGPFVLGYAFSFRKAGTSPQDCNLHAPGTILIDQETWKDSFFTAKGVTCNLPAFANAVTRSGFLNAGPDSDGVLRRIPMVIRFGEDLYPSLTLAMLMQYRKMTQMKILKRAASGRVDLVAAKSIIPFDHHGSLVLRFCKREEIARRVSASEVLAGGVSPGEFKDKIVLVGFTAAGLESSYQTSAGLYMPVEIQAQALENLVNEEYVVRTGVFLLWELLLSLVLAWIGAAAVVLLRVAPGAAVCAVLLGGSWMAASFVFRSTGYLFSPLLPTVMIVTNYAVLNIVKGWLALAEKQRQLEKINQSLEQRVAEAVSELRRKDRILIQQGRQAAMGEMISNIAHQWRQPLNILALIVQELRITYGSQNFSKQSLEESVAKAMELIQHMSQTIEDFRNYFKPDKAKTHFTASQTIAKTLALAEANLSSMEIKTEVRTTDDPDIFGYPNEYSQVLLNLLLNSRDAFETNGVEGPRAIRIEVGQVDGRSVVTITDNAGGIPEDIIDKVFDPYFTTKGPDKGTGIGLYMAKTIIENNMGGNLSVRNTGDGVEFRIEV